VGKKVGRQMLMGRSGEGEEVVSWGLCKGDVRRKEIEKKRD